MQAVILLLAGPVVLAELGWWPQNLLWRPCWRFHNAVPSSNACILLQITATEVTGCGMLRPRTVGTRGASNRSSTVALLTLLQVDLRWTSDGEHHHTRLSHCVQKATNSVGLPASGWMVQQYIGEQTEGEQ